MLNSTMQREREKKVEEEGIQRHEVDISQQAEVSNPEFKREKEREGERDPNFWRWFRRNKIQGHGLLSSQSQEPRVDRSKREKRETFQRNGHGD